MSAAMALSPAANMPTTRPYRPPRHSENAAKNWKTPMTSVTQPHVLRSLRMNWESLTKKLAPSMAAMP
jgi:hypothetical protein